MIQLFFATVSAMCAAASVGMAVVRFVSATNSDAKLGWCIASIHASALTILALIQVAAVLARVTS